MVEAAVEPYAPWVAYLMRPILAGEPHDTLHPCGFHIQAGNRSIRKDRSKGHPHRVQARDLAAISGGWITATSANLSGDPSADEVSKISESVLHAVDLIIDTGPTPGGLPSTVVEPLESSLKMHQKGSCIVLPVAGICPSSRALSSTTHIRP